MSRDFVNIYNSTIGKNCRIAEFVEIGGAIIGDNCSIQAFCFLCPGVELEDGVFLGPHTVFTNVRHPRATRKGQFEKTLVKKGATIGANCTILCGVTIGENSVVGAGSVVTKDIPPDTTVVGNPAKILRKGYHS